MVIAAQAAFIKLGQDATGMAPNSGTKGYGRRQLALAFGILIVFLMVIGSVWTMYHLAQNLMAVSGMKMWRPEYAHHGGAFRACRLGDRGLHRHLMQRAVGMVHRRALGHYY